MTTTAAARELAEQTPDSRDRYIDFLRLFSIVVVVLGHWLMAVVTWHGSQFQTGNALDDVPGLWLATWALQVMPIFFFVGGFANLVTIDGLRRKGQGTPEFLAARVTRLLRPVVILLAIWFPAAFVLEHTGFDHNVLASATRLVCQPLWFIGVYLAVTALAPLMRDLHARHGAQAAAALAVIAITVDVVRFGAGIDAIGTLNVLFVWLFAQQLGFFYADGSLLRLRPSQLVATAVAAAAALIALVTLAHYPGSMVGLPGDKISNMSPPTVCLLVLTVFQVAVVMLLRPIMRRRLAHRSLWTIVVAGNGMIMTIFLWHLTAALIALGFLHHVGFPQPAGGSAEWWLTRPIWIASALLPLGLLLTIFARFERPRPVTYQRRHAHATATAGTGIALLSIAVFGVACSSIPALLANTPVDLQILKVSPALLLAATLGGAALIRFAVSEHSR
jgi:fucose 4-O-acetylase-like acetyltransferase